MRSVLLLDSDGVVVRLQRSVYCLLLSVLCGCVVSPQAAAQTPTGAADPGVAAQKPDTGPAVVYEGAL
jgi:hypothetical protein